MKDDMHIQLTHRDDVGSAWLVGAACVLGLLLVSLFRDPAAFDLGFTERNLAGGPAMERIDELSATPISLSR